VLQLHEYRSLIDLDRPVRPATPLPAEEVRRTVQELVRELANEPGAARVATRLPDTDDPAPWRRLLQALLTIRSPTPPLPQRLHAAIDALRQTERPRCRAVDVAGVRLIRLPGLRADVGLWQGDITALRADAIVNAANGGLVGCFQPFHACIDNAIHDAAGPRLREDCARIVGAQGHPEPTGAAKITRGYNLPARYVIHTVGPIVDRRLHRAHEAALASSYRACLDVAAATGGIRHIAFCSVSTGVFGYPKAQAARTAVATVRAWLAAHEGAAPLVVFDVFADADRQIYEDALARAGARSA
jgi:O-acetyl-ADP-ribose deacetylase (regulator of RNase III)